MRILRTSLRPRISFILSLLGAELTLHPLVETGDADDHALVGAAPDRFALVTHVDTERDGAPFDLQHLRGRSHSQSDRGCGDMADVEMDAEALMAGREEMLNRRQGGRLNHI